MSNNVYYGGTLVLTIKDTLVEEMTWYRTTIVTITLTRLPCLVDQTWLTSQKATPVQTLTVPQLNTESFNLSTLQTRTDTVFKKATDPYCGEINFEFVLDANQPFFTYDSMTEDFTFSPQLTDSVSTIINYSAQFSFADFPSLIWHATIQLNIACAQTSNQQAFDCGLLNADGQTNAVGANYEIHSGNQDEPLPVVNHIAGFTVNQEL